MAQHILVVDDDRVIRSLIAEALHDEGYDVETAANGGEALERVNGRCPDAIVLDLQMPVMDGRTFFDRLRSVPCTSPVLILSAYGAQLARRELGAEAALGKPFDLDELTATVHRLVTGWTAASG